MRRFEATYHVVPDGKDITIDFLANTEEQAVILAKQYRRDPFSIREVAATPKRFEVGKEYEPYDPGFPAIKVLRRTEKSVWVTNNQSTWMMRIKLDADGNEYAVDNSVPKMWRDVFTYTA